MLDAPTSEIFTSVLLSIIVSPSSAGTEIMSFDVSAASPPQAPPYIHPMLHVSCS